MSVVSLLGVNILNNPARFTDKYDLEITFECLEPLEKGKGKDQFASIFDAGANKTPATDLEWKLTYVGSATSYARPSFARSPHRRPL